MQNRLVGFLAILAFVLLLEGVHAETCNEAMCKHGRETKCEPRRLLGVTFGLTSFYEFFPCDNVPYGFTRPHEHRFDVRYWCHAFTEYREGRCRLRAADEGARPNPNPVDFYVGERVVNNEVVGNALGDEEKEEEKGENSILPSDANYKAQFAEVRDTLASDEADEERFFSIAEDRPQRATYEDDGGDDDDDDEQNRLDEQMSLAKSRHLQVRKNRGVLDNEVPVPRTRVTIADQVHLLGMRPKLDMRASRSNSIRSFIHIYGDFPIGKIALGKRPVAEGGPRALDVLSGGKLRSALVEAQIPVQYHLWLYFTIDINGVHFNCRTEKSIYVSVTCQFQSGEEDALLDSDNSQRFPKLRTHYIADFQQGLTFKTLVENAEKEQGTTRMYTYKAFSTNCQFYVLSLLAASNFLTEGAVTFAYQNMEGIRRFLTDDYSKKWDVVQLADKIMNTVAVFTQSKDVPWTDVLLRSAEQQNKLQNRIGRALSR